MRARIKYRVSGIKCYRLACVDQNTSYNQLKKGSHGKESTNTHTSLFQ